MTNKKAAEIIKNAPFLATVNTFEEIEEAVNKSTDLLEKEPNDQYNNMILELLGFEERESVFYITSRERADFQAYVKEMLQIT